MQRTLAVLSLAVLVNFNGNCLPATPEGYYQSKYDHVDLDTVLNSKRLVQYYAACLLGRGPCPPQGAELKRVLPEALESNCARCTEKQKAGAYRAIKRLRKEYPDIWNQLVEEYDPTEKYVQRFEESRKKLYVSSSNVPPAEINNVQSFTPVPSNVSPVSAISIDNRFGFDDSPATTNTASSTKSTTTSTKPSTPKLSQSSAASPAKKPPARSTVQSTVKPNANSIEPLPLSIPSASVDSSDSEKVTTNTEVNLSKLGQELGRFSFQLCKLLLGNDSDFCFAKYNVRPRRKSQGGSTCSSAY